MNTYSSLRDAALSNEHRDPSNQRRQTRLFGWNGTVNERDFPAAPTPVITRFTSLLPLQLNIPDSPFEGPFDEQIVFGGRSQRRPREVQFSPFLPEPDIRNMK
ncbi:hypothetical protein F2P79_011041 [Pimephales promelas]|nr:hypothetical protein F2P79_011041 [Pimephales promelas]